MLNHIIWLYGVLFGNEEGLMRVQYVVSPTPLTTLQDSIAFFTEYSMGHWDIYREGMGPGRKHTR